MFKIGDRVLLNRTNSSVHCIVIKTGSIPFGLPGSGSKSIRYLVREFDTYTVSGDEVETWVSGYALESDTQWYRDEQLKKIL